MLLQTSCLRTMDLYFPISGIWGLKVFCSFRVFCCSVVARQATRRKRKGWHEWMNAGWVLTECLGTLRGKESTQMTSVLQWCLNSLADPWDSASWYFSGKSVGYSGCDEVGYHTTVTLKLICYPFAELHPTQASFRCWLLSLPIHIRRTGEFWGKSRIALLSLSFSRIK